MAGALTIRLDDETLAAIDQIARQTERSRTSVVEQAVQTYVALQRWQLAKIQEGLDDLAAGRVASEEDVAYLDALAPLLSEWDSEEDNAAYNGL
jgi:predicted transcriptional regulator